MNNMLKNLMRCSVYHAAENLLIPRNRPYVTHVHHKKNSSLNLNSDTVKNCCNDLFAQIYTNRQNFLLAPEMTLKNRKSVISLSYDQSHFKAAGIVPYAQAEDGKVYLLLGRQALYPHKSAGQLKGFGGGRDPGETLIYTALREAEEESRCVLDKDHACYNSEKISFDHVIVSEHNRCKYLQLMVPIAWDEKVPARFQTLNYTDPHLMEKLAVYWIACEEIYQVIQKAHQVSLQENRWPTEMTRTFEINVDSEKFSLSNDFVETLLVNYRNPVDSIHLLAQNVMPIPSSISSD